MTLDHLGSGYTVGHNNAETMRRELAHAEVPFILTTTSAAS